MKHTCRICAVAADAPTYTCREKMFGLGDPFAYFRCPGCGCLQIENPPTDFTRYYPPHYYSYHLQPVPQRGVKAWLAGRRDAMRLTGWPLSWLPGTAIKPADMAALARLPLQLGMRVLDVGCGRGQLLSMLYRAGFKYLTGIDPYLASDIEIEPGLVVRKQALEDLNQPFDLIMFHHVFEHLADGQRVLSLTRRLLAPDGRLLLRVPTVEGEAWERYRENWAQLDAPRHLYLHSRTSLSILAERSGLRIERCWCDSSEFQFWASELYKADTPLVDQSGEPVQAKRYFGPTILDDFAAQARKLNALGKGDQFVMILRSRHSSAAIR